MSAFEAVKPDNIGTNKPMVSAKKVPMMYEINKKMENKEIVGFYEYAWAASYDEQYGDIVKSRKGITRILPVDGGKSDPIYRFGDGTSIDGILPIGVAECYVLSGIL